MPHIHCYLHDDHQARDLGFDKLVDLTALKRLIWAAIGQKRVPSTFSPANVDWEQDASLFAFSPEAGRHYATKITHLSQVMDDAHLILDIKGLARFLQRTHGKHSKAGRRDSADAEGVAAPFFSHLKASRSIGRRHLKNAEQVAAEAKEAAAAIKADMLPAHAEQGDQTPEENAGEPPSPPAPPPPEAAAESAFFLPQLLTKVPKAYARATYTFVAEEVDELDFTAGDIIALYDIDDESGWYEGALNGRYGQFPGNHVRICTREELHALASASTPAMPTRSSKGSKGNASANSTPPKAAEDVNLMARMHTLTVQAGRDRPSPSTIERRQALAPLASAESDRVRTTTFSYDLLNKGGGSTHASPKTPTSGRSDMAPHVRRLMEMAGAQSLSRPSSRSPATFPPAVASSSSSSGSPQSSTERGSAALVRRGTHKRSETGDWSRADVSKLVNLAKEDFPKYTMEKYARSYFFVKPVKSPAAYKSIVTKLTAYGKAISRPLLKIIQDPGEIRAAMAAFVEIGNFMKGRKIMDSAITLCNAGLEGSQRIRDEIYVQIAKQSRYNKSKSQLELAWQLMAVISGVFPPSHDLLPYLSVHLATSKAMSDIASVSASIYHIRETLPFTVANGPRLFAPTVEEITAVMAYKKLFVTVKFADGTERNIFVGPQTTTIDVVRDIMDSIPLRCPTVPESDRLCFGLYQIATVGGKFDMESCLSDKSRMLDVICGWLHAQLASEADAKQKGVSDESQTLSFFLSFKAKYFVFSIMKEASLAKNVLRIYVLQAIHDVVHGVYPVSEEQAFELATIQAHMFLRAVDQRYRNCKLLADCLSSFFPAPHLKKLYGEFLPPSKGLHVVEVDETYHIETFYKKRNDLVRADSNSSTGSASSPDGSKRKTSFLKGIVRRTTSARENVNDQLTAEAQDTFERSVREAIAEKLIAAVGPIDENTDRQAIGREYLDTCQRMPLYGCLFFQASLSLQAPLSSGEYENIAGYVGEHLPDELFSKNTLKCEIPCVLGISEKGILRLNPETRALKHHIPLSTLSQLRFTFSRHFFMCMPGNPTGTLGQICYIFRTVHGEKIADAVSVYKSVPHNADKF